MCVVCARIQWIWAACVCFYQYIEEWDESLSKWEYVWLEPCGVMWLRWRALKMKIVVEFGWIMLFYSLACACLCVCCKLTVSQHDSIEFGNRLDPWTMITNRICILCTAYSRYYYMIYQWSIWIEIGVLCTSTRTKWIASPYAYLLYSHRRSLHCWDLFNTISSNVRHQPTTINNR